MQRSDISLEECLWCNHTSWMRDQMYNSIQLMEYSLDGSLDSSLDKQPKWFHNMCKDLSYCSACVDQYHNTIKTYLCGSKNAIVYSWNCKRIFNCLKEELELFDSCEESSTRCIETAIREVLKYSRLMLNEELCGICLKSLKLLLKQKSFELHERLQGLCLLLVNQDSQVSLWALKTFKSFGSVDCDEYAELENVIDWLLDVINFNFFMNHVDIDNSANWDDTQKVVLPCHLFTNKPREFWLGICTILSVMTKNCIQTCLLPSDLTQLIETVLVLLKDSDQLYDIPTFNSPQGCKNTVFWPALQGFVLLVDKLGSRFWMITTTTPAAALKAIKCNPYYQLQLRICYDNAAKLDSVTNDSEFSFSQLVYDDSLNKPSSSMDPLQERYHGFSLSWVVPFIKSLIDFGDYESSTIVDLLEFVCNIHCLSLHGDTNVSSTDTFQTVLPLHIIAKRVEDLFLPRESLQCISQSVDILFSQKVYSVFLQCKQAIFCMITVLCSYVLNRDSLVLSQNKQHLTQTARTYISLVMYCSTEKTASKLWYLVKQIGPLSPFLSVVSNQVGNSHSHTDLLHPDELCEVLVSLIAGKQSSQDIAGPFLYPHSFSKSALKTKTTGVTVIKQESFGEETNRTEDFIPLLDHDPNHQDSPTSCETTRKSSDGDAYCNSNLKQVSLKLKKLPVTVLKSERGELHYEFQDDSNKSSCMLSESECDTESCCSMNNDDDSDDLPSFFSFRKRRLTDVSTSSTVTIESELNEQKEIANEGPIKSIQLSRSVQLKESINRVIVKSGSDGIIYKAKSESGLPNLHSDCGTVKRCSEEHHLKVKNNSRIEEDNLKCNEETTAIVEEECCNYSEQNSDCLVLNSSSIVGLYLSKDNVSNSTVIDQEFLGSESNSIEILNLNSDDEIEHVFSGDSGDEDRSSTVYNKHTFESASLEKQQQLKINSNNDAGFSETVIIEQFHCENEKLTVSCNSSMNKEANLIVVPNAQHNLKFKPRTMELKTTNSLNSHQAKLSHVSDFQQSSTISKQLDKVQPAVPGRVPFSKSRIGSLYISNLLDATTKVQASKTKDYVTSKDVHKKQLESVSQSNSTTTDKVMVVVDPSRLYSKEEFFMEILKWDPTVFFQAKLGDKSVTSEGPYSLSNIAKVPVTFKSFDQYIEVFKPLLLLEAWDTIKDEMMHVEEKGKVFCARIDDCNLSSVSGVVSARHRLTVKGVITNNDAHPIDRDLVRLKFMPHGTNSTFDFPVMFGIVESISKSITAAAVFQSSEVSTKSNSRKELTLHLSISSFSSHFLSENLNVEILTVVSMSSFVRQWEGLISISRNMLCRDILHPRHKKYFGYFDDIAPVTKDKYQIAEFSFNASQFAAIALTTKALSLPYCIPQIVLLQGPPGTGKTHTIIGIISSFFSNQKLKVSTNSKILPGNRLKPPKPHLLVCAPSNAGIDVVVNRLMTNGLIVETEFWKKRYARMKKQDSASTDNSNADAFRVLRIGVPDKIDPKVFSVFFDEIVKKKTSEASKKLQTLRDEISKADKQIGRLDEEITSAQKKILSLRRGNKNDQICCEELNANVKDLQSRTKQLRLDRRKLTREATICSNDIKLIQQKILMEADIICCTLTSSGSQKLRECFQSKPQHFTAVIVDEAAQCSELLTLVPLLYHSTKLVLVGDPAQLPSTVKSMKAARLGYGQSLFERLFFFFTHESSNFNPVVMLQMQYRMHSKICQFPSEQFYHSQLLTHSSCDKEISVNPLLVFDLENGIEHVKDGYSYINELECQLIIKICDLLLEVASSSNIGIITPYRAQTKMIEMEIKKSRRYHGIEIGTVDSFQGREKDIILLSCVRVQHGGSIGFLTDHRRLNVAITRAKKALYIIGHLRTFEFNKYWSNLIAYANKHNLIVRVDENMSCVRDCLKVNPSTCVTENITPTKGKAKSNGDHQLRSNLSSSSKNAVTEVSSDVLVAKKHLIVDKSAFVLHRKPIQYIDALPKTRSEVSMISSSKNSTTKGIPTKVKRKFSSSGELQHIEHHFSPNKTDTIKSSDLTTTDNQKLWLENGSSYGKEFNTSQVTVNIKNSRLPSKTNALCSTVASTTLQYMDEIASNVSIPSVPSNATNSCSYVNIHNPCSSRQVEFSNVPTHALNDKTQWGGQRKRISHFANTSRQTKRRQCDDDAGVKKAKYN